MNDPNSPDRVPLDRPPAPRFNPLPDLPDLPEMPRGSSIPPTPSVPIPAPPMSLPAPRVMVDPPKPTVSVEPPRPAPRTTTPPPKPAEAPKPVTASTPAPKGRWVGEALATLVRPTKSKATVLAAAGSLVAGAFGLQVLVSQVNRGDAVATTAEPSAPKPKPAVADDPGTSAPQPFFAGTAAEERLGEESEVIAAGDLGKPFLPALPDQFVARPSDSSGRVALPPRPKIVAPDSPIRTVGGETPAVPPIPTLPMLEAPAPNGIPPAPTVIPVVTGPAPVAAPVPVPIPLPTPAPVPAPIPLPMSAPIPATAEPAKATPAPPALVPVVVPATPAPVAVNTVPVEAPKGVPATPPVERVIEKPLLPEPSRSATVPPFAASAFTETPPPKPVPPVSVTPATLPAPPPDTRVLELPATPAFGIVDVPREPLRPVPTPTGEVRTDYDVDLHPAQAGQTYESISKQHYGDAKYADALRASNKNRDPGREEIQLPPTHVLRKFTGGTRTPAAANPIAPASGETWSPSPATAPRPAAVGRSYTVLKDDTTFRDLAGMLLNDRNKYKRISDLNPTIDANAKLNKGDKIAVP